MLLRFLLDLCVGGQRELAGEPVIHDGLWIARNRLAAFPGGVECRGHEYRWTAIIVTAERSAKGHKQT